MTTARCVAAAVPLLLLATRAAGAESVAVDLTVDVTTVSDYVWRGERMAARGATPAAQTYVELGLAGPDGDRLAVGAWTSAFLTGRAAAFEVDPYVAYAYPVGPATVTAGHAIYLQTAATPVDTMHETSLAVAFAGLPVAPSLGLAVDLVRTDSRYAWAALDHAGRLGPVAIETRLEAGASQATMVEAGLQHATLSARAALTLRAGAYLAASGSIAYGARSAAWAPTLGLSFGVSR
jgi:uncharacterized protein (TIGR02001 family)